MSGDFKYADHNLTLARIVRRYIWEFMKVASELGRRPQRQFPKYVCTHHVTTVSRHKRYRIPMYISWWEVPRRSLQARGRRERKI